MVAIEVKIEMVLYEPQEYPLSTGIILLEAYIDHLKYLENEFDVEMPYPLEFHTETTGVNSSESDGELLATIDEEKDEDD